MPAGLVSSLPHFQLFPQQPSQDLPEPPPTRQQPAASWTPTWPVRSLTVASPFRFCHPRFFRTRSLRCFLNSHLRKLGEWFSLQTVGATGRPRYETFWSRRIPPRIRPTVDRLPRRQRTEQQQQRPIDPSSICFLTPFRSFCRTRVDVAVLIRTNIADSG
jgi:hypothetical protein